MLSQALIIFFFFTTCSATIVPGHFIFPKSLWATSTCGSPPKTSCLLHAPPPPNLGQLHAIATKCYECTAYKHTIKNIVSGKKDWWQSANNVSEVNITIFLPHKFYILAIILDVGPARMPRQWVLEKSVDNENFTPWRVFGDKIFCMNFNSKQPQNSRLYCSDKMSSLNSGKEIIILLSDTGISFCSNIDSPGWFEASAIRLRFQKFETFHGDYIPNEKHFERFLYYTLENVAIYGENATTDCVYHLLPVVNELNNVPVAVKVEKNIFGRLNSVSQGVKIINSQIKKLIKTSSTALNFFVERKHVLANTTLEAFSNELLLAETTLGLANKYRTKLECIDQLKCRLRNIQSSFTSIITKLRKQNDLVFEKKKSVVILKKLLVNFSKLKEVLVNELQPSVIHVKEIMNSNLGNSVDDYLYIYNDDGGDLKGTIVEIEYKKDLLIRKLNYHIQDEFKLTTMLLKSRQRVSSLKLDLRKESYQMRTTELILQDVAGELSKINEATPPKILLETPITAINISAITGIGVLKRKEFSRLKETFGGIFKMIDTIYSGVKTGEELNVFMTGKIGQLRDKNELILQKQAVLENKLNILKTKLRLFYTKSEFLNKLRNN